MGALLLLQNGALAFIVVKEECGKTVAGPAVDNDTAEPPSQARWAHQQTVDGADGDGKSVVAQGAPVSGYSRWWRHQI